MSRYHFHVQVGDRVILDQDGVDLPSLMTGQGDDARAAEKCWEDVLRFIQDLPHRTIIITDEAGRIVFVLAL